MSILLIFTAFIPYLVDIYTVYASSALASGMASRVSFLIFLTSH